MPPLPTFDMPFDALPRWLWLATAFVPDVVLAASVVLLWRRLVLVRNAKRQPVAGQTVIGGQEVVATERAWLRATLEGMLDPLAMIEPVRDDERHVVDFSFLEVNPAACAWLGGDRDQLVGSRLCDSLPGVESSGLLQQLGAVMDTGAPMVLDDFPLMLRGVGPRRLDVRGIRGEDWITLVWRDVSERHDAIQRLAASEEQFRLLAENSTDVIVRIDANDTIQWISPSVTPVLGWTPAECIGRRGREFLSAADARDRSAQDMQYDTDRARDRAGRGGASRTRIRAAAGDTHWIEMRTSPYRTVEGDVSGVVATLHVVDAEIRMEHDLERRARIDELTGLCSRQELLERLAAAIASRGTTVGLVWCDIDAFKAINDVHGHAAGDAVLAALGKRIRGCLRSPDDVGGRIGGDELMVILRGVADLDEAAAFAETLRRRAAEPIPAGDGLIQATVSVGATLAGPDEGVDEVLARADDAMYRAKEAGRNRVVALPPAGAVMAAS